MRVDIGKKLLLRHSTNYALDRLAIFEEDQGGDVRIGNVDVGVCWIGEDVVVFGAVADGDGLGAGWVGGDPEYGFNVCSLVVFGVLIFTKHLVWDSLASYTIGMWAVESLNFIFINSLVSLSFAVLFQGLRKSLEKEN